MGEFQFKRGTNANRLLLSGVNTPPVGTPIYTTDTKKLFIGDGTTAGGVEVGGTPTAHTHPASDISAGTFGAGNYTFPGMVSLEGTSLHIDSDGSSNTTSLLFSAGNGILTHDTSADRFTLNGDLVLGSVTTNQNVLTMTAEGTPAGRSVNAIQMNGTGGHSQGFFTKRDDDADANWFCGYAYGSSDVFIINREDSGGNPDESSTDANFAIAENGWVGIGTTNPSSSLDVVGRVRASTDFFEAGTALSAKYAGIAHLSDTDNPHSVDETDILPDQTDNSGKVLSTNGSTASWNDPAAPGAHTHPASEVTAGTFSSGNFTFDGSLYCNDNLYINADDGTANSNLYFHDGATRDGALFYFAQGDSQFATNKPLAIGGDYITVDGPEIAIGADGSNVDTTLWFGHSGSHSADSLSFDYSADRFQLSNDINITGVVTASSQIISSSNIIADNGSLNGKIRLDSSEPVGGVAIDMDGTSGGWARGYTFVNGTTKLIGGFGATGPNASTITRLYMANAYNSNGIFVLPSNGFTGINDITPSYELDVNGDIRSTGQIFSGTTDIATMIAAGGGGITEHHDLDGLADDDHTQYHNDTRGEAWLTGNTHGDIEFSSLTATVLEFSPDGEISYDSGSTTFNINQSLSVTDNLIINPAGTNEDVFLYFGQEGQPDEYHLKYDETDSRFEFNTDLDVNGDVTATAFITDYVHLVKSTLVDNIGGANGSTTDIRWDVELNRDSSTFLHQTGSLQHQIVVLKAGRYSINATVSGLNGGSGRITNMLYFTVNGTANKRSIARNYSRGSSYGDASLNISTEVDLATNNVISIQTGVDDTDGTYTVNTIAAECECIIRRIG